MLALKNVSKVYGRSKILSGASLQVRPKDCLCIVGDGGMGKSTIVKLLLRMEDPTSGSVTVDGVDLKVVPPQILQLYRRRLGVSFQEPMLLEHATLSENIALPLSLFDVPQTVADRMTNDLIKRLNLTAKADTLAGELSASEQSLVSIARAIIASPMIVIADEPLLHLDATQAKTAVEMLTNMQKHGTTLIILSRFTETGEIFGARMARLANGEITEMKTVPRRSSEKADTHRILEETGEQIQTVIDQKPEKKPDLRPAKRDSGRQAKNDDDGGKRVRITSIGSGL